MLKKTIAYNDTDGIPRVEDFYFNLTKAEIIELQVSRAGGFLETLQALSTRNDQQEILSIVKEVILKSYGERTDQGRHFIKKPEFAEAFSHTEAYSNLFMELFQDADRALDFMQGLMPADILTQVRAEQESQKNVANTQQVDMGREVTSDMRVRMAPQDHLKKAEPVFQKVRDTDRDKMLDFDSSLLKEPADDTQPLEKIYSGPRMTQEEFNTLSRQAMIDFIQIGGQIV